MLQILSSLTLLSRFDYDASADILAGTSHSGICNGTWVSVTSTGVDMPTAGAFAMPIWSESYRDGTAGWSPDVAATGKVTVLYGKFRAFTDQFVGTPSLGDKLFVNENGKLTDTDPGSGIPVAICTKEKNTSFVYLSKKYDAGVIEYVTI